MVLGKEAYTDRAYRVCCESNHLKLLEDLEMASVDGTWKDTLIASSLIELI